MKLRLDKNKKFSRHDIRHIIDSIRKCNTAVFIYRVKSAVRLFQKSPHKLQAVEAYVCYVGLQYDHI